jgi:hypothetical protein
MHLLRGIATPVELSHIRGLNSGELRQQHLHRVHDRYAFIGRCCPRGTRTQISNRRSQPRQRLIHTINLEHEYDNSADNHRLIDL